jgi:hypothetical protein
VHCHLCGPVKTVTIGGSAYFLTFVDDRSKKTCVYIMKNKSDVLSVYKKFKVSVESETRKKLKCIHWYTHIMMVTIWESLKLIIDRAYCRENWIRYKRSLRWNGIAERMRKALLERVRCLLSLVGESGVARKKHCGSMLQDHKRGRHYISIQNLKPLG